MRGIEENADRKPYPVRLEGELQPDLSRWLWVVKWLLAIPHYFVLAFLWLTLLVLTVVAFFAILFTGRYPRGIFDFNLGVLRWTWRVAFYSYGALGSDRYPPFTLDDVPDYPARLSIEYPERLSRGLVLVKWWLLAIPHYILVAVFLGGSSFVLSQSDTWDWWFHGGLVGLLVVFAGLTLVFVGGYPRGIFDFVLGLDRWVARVAGYVLLMRDEYPPFRLDQGGHDPEPTPEPEDAVVPAALETQPEAAAAPRSPAGRVALIVVGVLAGVVALALLVGGCALVAVDRTQRDDDGFLMSPSRDFTSATYAIVVESVDIDSDGEWALDSFLGTVRIKSESDRPVFVGIAETTAVDRYLLGVEHDVVSDLDSSGDPEYSFRPGSTPRGPPGAQTFWAASASGAGEQTIDWEPEDGDWSAVVMNRDASRGVSADMSVGAELDSVLWIGIGLLIVGALLAAGAALAITAGARRRRA